MTAGIYSVHAQFYTKNLHSETWIHKALLSEETPAVMLKRQTASEMLQFQSKMALCWDKEAARTFVSKFEIKKQRIADLDFLPIF